MAREIKSHTFPQIVLSISIIIAAACLILGALKIYYTGDGYSREIVAATFSKISIPVYICLALILVVNFIVNHLTPLYKINSKFYKPKNFCQNKERKLSPKSALIIKIAVITIGIVSLIFGAIFGGFADVLTKAVNICTECIGLG